MNRLVLMIVALLAVLSAGAAPLGDTTPFETRRNVASTNPIDALVEASLEQQNIRSANRCSDAVFVRRAYLDVIGMLPKPKEVQDFLKADDADKRARLIDELLVRPAFADYWAMKWSDLLRVKAEFPINLWPNAVQAYHRWIYDAIRNNIPYDRFARALLTSSGSNFRVPQVNFYRAMQGHEPATIAATVALTFMGTRIENWPEDRRAGMEALFSRVAYKPTAEWKEEIVYLNPAPAKTLQVVLPDGAPVAIDPDMDPRQLFAAWLTEKENPWFARNVVNRLWAWLMGRGIIHEVDDIRPDNPPVNPELLACLEKELLRSNYDLKHIYRLILTSQTYQRSSIPRSDDPAAEKLFAFYPVRRLDAEVLIDALTGIFGGSERYSSRIPEPFTFLPNDYRTVALADGSITSAFLELFGRPARDSGFASERNNEITDAQRLHLLNSTHIQKKIRDSWKTKQFVRLAKKDPRQGIRSIYLHLLSRPPTEAEIEAIVRYAEQNNVEVRQAVEDLVWSLVNSKEFLYRH
ncbi:MAG: DUF1553 domain-containing protein [Candidatus Hydrogenedentes bacterium]|nr:DUF1553 domain-containing protein [Candidatus Hydrogenedentota bacterium]